MMPIHVVVPRSGAGAACGASEVGLSARHGQHGDSVSDVRPVETFEGEAVNEGVH
jgi:hypothetical protein